MNDWSYDHGQCDAPDVELTQIVTGYQQTCGLDPDGKVICWGCELEIQDVGQCDPPEWLQP